MITRVPAFSWVARPPDSVRSSAALSGEIRARDDHRGVDGVSWSREARTPESADPHQCGHAEDDERQLNERRCGQTAHDPGEGLRSHLQRLVVPHHLALRSVVHRQDRYMGYTRKNPKMQRYSRTVRAKRVHALGRLVLPRFDLTARRS